MNREVERILRETEYNAIQEIAYLRILEQEQRRRKDYIGNSKLPRIDYTLSLERQNRKLRVGIITLAILTLFTLLIPDFWYILLVLAFILGMILFIPFTIWTLVRTDTVPFYDFWIGGIYKYENQNKR